jgi:hypothetical protein
VHLGVDVDHLAESQNRVVEVWDEGADCLRELELLEGYLV